MKVPEGRPTVRRFNGGFGLLRLIESRRDERKHGYVRVISAARSGLHRFLFTPIVKTMYLFSVVELVALRRVAPRPAAQRLPATERSVRAVPPLHAAGLSQRDNRYHKIGTRPRSRIP